MNRYRLEHLLHIAKNLPMDKLDMGTWGGCGTVACLGGWACRDEYFMAQGLTLDEYNGGMVPTYDDFTSFQALDAFFDLQGLETTHLFSPIAYSAKPSRAELLEHINDILNGDFEKKWGHLPAYLDDRPAMDYLEREREEIAV